MTLSQVIFLLIAAFTLGAAIMVVTERRMMRSAFWLVLALLGVAIVFATLEASYLTAIEIVVYIGAIATLILFAVMLTQRVMSADQPQTARWWVVGAGAAAAFLAVLAALIFNWSQSATLSAPLAADALDIAQLGIRLTSINQFALPFEVASILLIAALVGAIYIAAAPKK